MSKISLTNILKKTFKKQPPKKKTKKVIKKVAKKIAKVKKVLPKKTVRARSAKKKNDGYPQIHRICKIHRKC